MRERERKSRSQIAQQAARDSFMEQASGAVFAEPIKVSDSKITLLISGRVTARSHVLSHEGDH